MNNRRSFLQGLLALPFVGWAFKGIAQEPPIEQVIDNVFSTCQIDQVGIPECVYYGTFNTNQFKGNPRQGDLMYIGLDGKITRVHHSLSSPIGICIESKDNQGFIKICTNGKLWA